MTYVRRSLELRDAPLEAPSGGTGRRIIGYLAAFDSPTNISDAHGVYDEQISSGAFTKTLQERGNKFLVTYNHGLTLYGSPSSEFSIPLGVPAEIKSDSRGVLAGIELHNTPLADQILEGVRSGSIGGMSFTGTFIKSSPDRPRGGYKPDRAGSRTLVTRHEVAMTEFGPTPVPAYDAAEIIGVRALVASLEGLSKEERAELVALLTEARAATLNEPATSDTPSGAVGDDEPPAGHSTRHLTPAQRVRMVSARLTVRGGRAA